MTCKALRHGVVGIIAMASTLHIATASAGPCSGEITEFQNSLPRDKNGEFSFIASMPQSIDAQLEHQPTRESVERAKRQAQDQVMRALAQAEALDSEGRRNECGDAIAKARHLLNP
jgi:hypothetical protein